MNGMCRVTYGRKICCDTFGIRAFNSISSGSSRKIYYKGTPNQWAGIDFAMADGASYPSSHPFYNNTSTNNHERKLKSSGSTNVSSWMNIIFGCSSDEIEVSSSLEVARYLSIESLV